MGIFEILTNDYHLCQRISYLLDWEVDDCVILFNDERVLGESLKTEIINAFHLVVVQRMSIAGLVKEQTFFSYTFLIESKLSLLIKSNLKFYDRLISLVQPPIFVLG